MNRMAAVIGTMLLGGVMTWIYDIGWTDLRVRKKPDMERVRVACVGDSITYGNQVRHRSKNCYPSVVQEQLGETFQVDNFGLNARTLMNSGDRPYRREAEYQRSLDFLPDVVVIKFGTNDSKAMNWKTEEDFRAEYESFLEAYRSLPSKPKLYVCTPAAAYGRSRGNEDIYTYKIQERGLKGARKAIRKMAEEDADLTLIDVAEFTKEHRDWFVWDGIHLNQKGARNLGTFIAAQIRQQRTVKE